MSQCESISAKMSATKHDEAMSLCDEWIILKAASERDIERESKVLSRAFEMQCDAIKLAEFSGVKEPTLTMLYRSASTIAQWRCSLRPEVE